MRTGELAPVSEPWAPATYLAAPDFSDAAARYCREMAAPDAPAWPATKLFHQLGRYMVSFLLIHHYQDWHCHDGHPATLSRLQASCTLSARQTASIVAGLRAGRLLTTEPLAVPGTKEPEPSGAPPRLPGTRRQSAGAKVLVPAPAVTHAIARSMLAVLAAADALEGKTRAAQFTGDFALQNELVYRSAEFVARNGSLLDGFPRIRHFTERDGGYLILCAVMAHVLGTPVPAVPLSCRYLAQHFRVSRSHVSNILMSAAQSHWFTTDGRGHLAYIAPDLTEEFKRWVGAEMAHYARIADEMLAAR